MRSELIQVTPSLAEHFLSKNRVTEPLVITKLLNMQILCKEESGV